MITQILNYRSADELPSVEMANCAVLTYSPADGWYTGLVLVLEDDDQIFEIGIYDRQGRKLTPGKHFTLWALLNTPM